MPHYYFHLRNDLDVTDEEGREFPDLASARAYALQQARGLIGALATEEGRIVLHHRIDIEDQERALLDSVWWSDAVKVEE